MDLASLGLVPLDEPRPSLDLESLGLVPLDVPTAPPALPAQPTGSSAAPASWWDQRVPNIVAASNKLADKIKNPWTPPPIPLVDSANRLAAERRQNTTAPPMTDWDYVSGGYGDPLQSPPIPRVADALPQLDEPQPPQEDWLRRQAPVPWGPGPQFVDAWRPGPRTFDEMKGSTQPNVPLVRGEGERLNKRHQEWLNNVDKWGSADWEAYHNSLPVPIDNFTLSDPEQFERAKFLNQLITGEPYIGLPKEQQAAEREKIARYRQQMKDTGYDDPVEWVAQIESRIGPQSLPGRMAQSAWEGLKEGTESLFKGTARTLGDLANELGYENSLRSGMGGDAEILQDAREREWREKVESRKDLRSASPFASQAARMTAGTLGRIAPGLAMGGGAPTYGLMMADTFNDTYNTQRAQGVDVPEAFANAGVQAIIEGGTEIAGGAVAKRAGLVNLESAFSRQSVKAIQNAVRKGGVKTMLTVAGGALGEGAEEAAAEVLGGIRDALFNYPVDMSNLPMSFTVGTLAGLAGHVPAVAKFLADPTRKNANDAGLPPSLTPKQLQEAAVRAATIVTDTSVSRGNAASMYTPEQVAAMTPEERAYHGLQEDTGLPPQWPAESQPEAPSVAPPDVPPAELPSFPPPVDSGVAAGPQAADAEIVPESKPTRLMDKSASFVEERIDDDNIATELYEGPNGSSFVRIMDLDSGELVGLAQYPSMEAGIAAYSKGVSLQDATPPTITPVQEPTYEVQTEGREEGRQGQVELPPVEQIAPPPAKKTIGKKRPIITSQEFRQQLTDAATSPEEADALYGLVEARADAAGESMDDYVGKRIAGVEQGPQSGSVAIKQGALRPGRLPRGEVQFIEDGRAIVRAFTEAQDASTLAHEVGHVFRRDLTGKELATAEKWAGAVDGKWDRPAEEKFARGFERYLRDGKAPTPALDKIFHKFRLWLSTIYRKLKSSPLDVKITPKMRAVYDSLFVGKRLGKKPAGDVELIAESPDLRRERSRAIVASGKFKAGDRVKFIDRDGSEKTGTVRSVDPQSWPDSISINVDQIKSPGGVPLGRIAQIPGYHIEHLEEPATADAMSEEQLAESPQQRLSRAIQSRLSREAPISRDEFFAMADREYGGSRAQGKYGDSEAYDALETAVNGYIHGKFDPTVDAEEAKRQIAALEQLVAKLPQHKARTGEKDTLQQFSTPPAYAYLANWVANIRSGDVVLEPSAGTGGLAVHAINAKATVYGNEIDENRAALLKQLPLAGVFTEDAERIAGILPKKMPAPTVVVMNPPFSRAGRRLGDKMVPGTDRKHINEAIRMMPSGGRLVAIIGAGLHGRGKAFNNWLADLPYDVKADIELGRDVYRGYGTTFPTRLLVIDKLPRGGETVTAQVQTLAEAVDLLNGVRDERQPTRPTEPQSPQVAESGRGPVAPVQPPVSPVDAGEQATTSTRSGGEVRTRTPKPSVSDVGVEREGDTAGDRGQGRKPVQTTQGQPAADAGRSTGGESAREPTATSSVAADAGNKLDVEVQRGRRTKEFTDSTFEPYEPSVRVKGAKKHPASLVESAAMAAIPSPAVTYQPSISKKIVEGYTTPDGLQVGISDVQLEAVAYAGEAHSQTLPSGVRRGFMIGDGTGVGKAREISGIILDNWNQGRQKAVWVSKNDKLFEPAREEWSKVGGVTEDVFNHSKIASGAPIGADKGILFTTYSTLWRSASDQAASAGNAKSRLDQIVDWLGDGFDGVVIFDEAHEMGSAIERGSGLNKKKASNKAVAGLDLQDRLPNARIVYLSATSATEVANLAYASRLGLWGDGTPFASREQFVDRITSGGVAAMEKVAADMKALGMYLARNISFNDGTTKGTVTYERLEHQLTKDQDRAYTKMSEAWQTVFRHMAEALELTGAKQNGIAVGRARSNFWSANQRFWNQVITAMQTPTAIKQIERSLAAGHSAVVQLTNTNESAQKRALSGRDKDDDIDDVDVSPKYILIDYVSRSFPTAAYEEYIDDNGNTRTRPVVDSEGNIVHDPAAVEMKERLLDELSSLQVANRGALDMLIDHFGEDMVAEVTGRSERLVMQDGKLKRQKRSSRASKADIASFMDGKKRILIFSEAGGTGASYHADLTRKNQQKRDHILLQPGWRADTAVQGLGRSHRSNQAQAPTYFLIHTNLKGQKRFISTIARRLGQLGALTKGQRQAGEAGVFSATDNLESTEAHEALHDLYRDIQANRVESISTAYLADALGLEIIDSQGNVLATLPPITQFMNRVLSLPPAEQNAVFDEFDRRFHANVEAATAAGTLDQGMETVKADRITKVSEQTVYTHPTGAETKHVVVRVGRKTKPTTWGHVQSVIPPDKLLGYVVSEKTGKVWAVENTGITAQNDDGSLTRKLKLHGAMGIQYNLESVMARSGNWQRVEEATAKTNWDDQVANAPEMHEEDMHILSGVLLPIWDRLPESNTQVKRLLTEEGEQILGRVIPHEKVRDVLKKLGVSAGAPKLSPQQAAQAVQSGQTLVLANDWRIKRSRVEGEWTIELTGPDYSHHDELERLGVNRRRIGGYNMRYFIPTGDQAAATIERIVASRPITDILGTARDDMAGASRGPMLTPLNHPVAVAPKSQREIINDLAKGLGLPIRFGRLTTKKFAGYFKPKANLIASARANDVPIISHEAGHKLDAMFGLSSNKSIASELDMLGDPQTPGSRSSWTKSKTIKYKRGEGVAEFVRYWLTDPAEAQKLAPSTFLAFDQILDANRDLATVLRTAQEDIRVWRTAEPQARLRSQISRGEDPTKVRYSLDQFTRDVVDDLHYLKLATDDAIKGFPGLPASRQPYLLARNLRGSYGMADTFIRSGVVDFKTKKVDLGTSLEDALKPVAGRMRDFGDWIVAKRAQELHKQGRETGLVPSDVDAVVALYDNNAQFQAAFDAVKEWNDAVLTYAVDAGLVTKQSAANMRRMNQDYVPFHRLFEVGANEPTSQESNRSGSGLNPGKPGSLKRLKGSTRNIVDPIETMIKNAYAVVTAAEKAAISNAVADMASLPDMGKWVEEVASPAEAVNVPLDRIRSQLEDAGADLSQVDDDLLMTFFVKSTSPVFGENTIRVVRPNGQTKFYRLNRYLHDTFLALDLDDAGKLIRIFSAPAQLLRAGVVLEPGFNLANAFRDTFGAAVVGKYGALPFETTLRGVAALIGKPNLVAEWAASGGRSAVEANYFDRKKMQQFLAEKISKELSPAERSMVWLRSPLSLLRAMASFTEEATRIGEYEKAYKSLIKGGMAEGDARRLAAFEARDRQDFAKGGAKTKILRHMTAFWNAQLQANVKLAESFKNRPARTLLTGLAFVTLPKLLEQALNWDDEDYWDRPQWERDLFYMIPYGKDEAGHTRFIRLPVPFEIGVIFATIPGRMLQWGKENDPKAMSGIGDVILKSSVPNPTPQSAQLIYETIMTGEQGWSVFRGRPVVPDSLIDLPPDMRWDEHTSTLAKKIGQTFNIAPMKIDYAIESTTGGLGKIFSGRKTPDDRFFTTPLAVSAQAIHDFYAIRKELTQARRKERLTGESDGLGPVMSKRFERDADKISALRSKAQDATEQEAAKLQDEAYKIAKQAIADYRKNAQPDDAALDYATTFAKTAIINDGRPRRKLGEAEGDYNARVKEWMESERDPALNWLRSRKSSPIVQQAVKAVRAEIPSRPAHKGGKDGYDPTYRKRRAAWNAKYGESAALVNELTAP